MKENTIVVLCGKSSSGKDTLASYFKTQGYKFIISHTTRPMRENESEENPYYFISDKDFKESFNVWAACNVFSASHFLASSSAALAASS